MTKHSDLSGADLHEPKGAASAISGQVYVADGAGSGTWTDLTPANIVEVSSADDFPAAVAGVRTLADNTHYRITGSVDVGTHTFVLGDKTLVTGTYAQNDAITSSTSGTLFTATQSFRVANLTVNCTSGTVFDFNGTSVEGVFLSNLIITGAQAIGTFQDFLFFVCELNLWTAIVSTGITLAGTNSIAIFRDSRFDVDGGIAIDLGVATFDFFTILNVDVENASGVTGIDVAASGANINTGGFGSISNTRFSTVASASNFSAGDPRWSFGQAVGLPSSASAAQGSIESNATATSFSLTGAGNEVAVAFGTGFVGDVEQNFTISNAGRYTYNAEQTKTFYVDATMYASIGGGATREYVYYIAKNGTIIGSSESKRTYDGSNAGANSCSSIVTLATTDYIELYVVANTATTALTVDTCSLKIVEV